MTETAIVIPARLESERLPQKVLLNDTGKYLIQHTWEAARRCDRVSAVYIASSDEPVLEAGRAFGAEVIETGTHNSGTSRVAEAAESINARNIINLQADEPDVTCTHIHTLLDLLEEGWEMTTLATPIKSRKTVLDEHSVKVVKAGNRAVYFSRSPVPWDREQFEVERDGEQEDEARINLTSSPRNLEESPWLRHIGMYGFQRTTLLRWPELPESPLAEREDLEQLRALAAGIEIGVGVVSEAPPGIDTREEYEKFVSRTNT